VCSLSNSRDNARSLGAWYVNANNAPDNANADNWGARLYRNAERVVFLESP